MIVEVIALRYSALRAPRVTDLLIFVRARERNGLENEAGDLVVSTLLGREVDTKSSVSGSQVVPTVADLEE